MPIEFEQFFRGFVTAFGGEVLRENDAKTADFLFRNPDVLAELKTLEEDARTEHAERLTGLITDWTRRGLIRIFGRVRIDLQKLNPVLQREWLQILQAPVERIVAKANRQIRSSKKSLGLPSAKGLLLVANDGNFLHTNPTDYIILVARVLAKKTANGERRFPHIHGIVYFSYRVGSLAEGMPFWASGDTEPRSSTDLVMREFQEKLRSGWFSYLEKAMGRPVTLIKKEDA